MNNDNQSSRSDSSLSDEIESLVDETYTYNISSSRRYSGDGTWIESHLIFALVEASDRAVAASKGAAALENRNGRPEPLFAHEGSDTYDLLLALDSIPLTVQGTPWERASPIAEVDEMSSEPMQRLLEVAPFDDENEVCVVSEWGDMLESQAAVKDEIASFTSQGWLIAGIALAPLGAGDGNDEYIGNNYEVYCPNCGEPKQAECINVTHDEEEGMDAGIWVCQDCDHDYRGTHPRGPARLSRKDPQP